MCFHPPWFCASAALGCTSGGGPVALQGQSSMEAPEDEGKTLGCSLAPPEIAAV